jgi:glycosyltransferase involved in cell wall biosynthesis
VTDKSIEIIIPARNMGGELAKALDTLVPQLAGGDALTVVDDASTDDTAGVAEDSGAGVLTLGRSRGPYFARQVAANRSAADILLFIDARCRALPGLLDAHRALHSKTDTALSCTDVRTQGGPTLAARVAEAQQPFSLDGRVGVPGRPDFYPTANLGISKQAFSVVGGFREMRSGADADICWRIQNQSLGRMAIDTRTLMEWEPRATMRDLASQWRRYGASTAYLEWLYGDISPSTFGTPLTLTEKLRRRFSRAGRTGDATITDSLARLAITAVYQYGYVTARRQSKDFTAPEPYQLDGVEAAS